MLHQRPHDPLFVLREHTTSVICCNFFRDRHGTADSPLANWLLTGDVAGVVKLWDLSLRRSLLTFHPFSEATKMDTQGPAPKTGSPFNPGAISVGFLWLTGNSGQACEPDSSVPAAASTSTQPMPLTNTPAVASASGRPSQRQRFRLTRPTQTASASLPAGENPALTETLVFYTQCRNQNLYIWSLRVATNGRRDAAAVFVPQPDSLRLEYKLFVPQHGFCAADVLICGTTAGLIAVPHDTNGQVTIWRISGADEQSGGESKSTSAHTLPSSSPASPHEATDTPNPDSLADTDPRAALIARSQAEEDARLSRLENEAAGNATASAVSEGSVVKVNHVCTFSCCGSSFKGGVIMQLRLRDAQHMSVAFESGHISLCQIRSAPSHGGATGAAVKAHLLCATRTFAEPAATCLWSTDTGEASRVVATSATGHVQSYTVSSVQESTVLALELCWEERFPKGLGSAALQGHLLILGAWDQTIRVLDVRTGSLLSILTQHCGTVQQVAAVASRASALQASFGFDSRQPHLYAANARFLPAAPSPVVGRIEGSASTDASGVLSHVALNGDTSRPERLVYLFSSCSDDGTVAVWRVDLHDVLDAKRSASARIA